MHIAKGGTELISEEYCKIMDNGTNPSKLTGAELAVDAARAAAAAEAAAARFFSRRAL